MSEDYSRVKILVVGPSKSGKSCLIKNYCEGRFVKRYLPTIGIDYGVRTIEIQNKPIKVNFFDASGALEFKPIRQEFYADSQAVIFVVDASVPSSLIECADFFTETASFNIPLNYLVISKTDLGMKLNENDIAEFTKKIGGRSFKASSMTGENVEMLFGQIFKDVHLQFLK
ncbi:RabB [Hexamita inflata]|uniref:RabB n=1 Tax=Hexamita inflata TaxID=28002 RepID=A0ABP1GI25_9EUKA